MSYDFGGSTSFAGNTYVNFAPASMNGGHPGMNCWDFTMQLPGAPVFTEGQVDTVCTMYVPDSTSQTLASSTLDHSTLASSFSLGGDTHLFSGNHTTSFASHLSSPSDFHPVFVREGDFHFAHHDDGSLANAKQEDLFHQQVAAAENFYRSNWSKLLTTFCTRAHRNLGITAEDMVECGFGTSFQVVKGEMRPDGFHVTLSTTGEDLNLGFHPWSNPHDPNKILFVERNPGGTGHHTYRQVHMPTETCLPKEVLDAFAPSPLFSDLVTKPVSNTDLHLPSDFNPLVHHNTIDNYGKLLVIPPGGKPGFWVDVSATLKPGQTTTDILPRGTNVLLPEEMGGKIVHVDDIKFGPDAAYKFSFSHPTKSDDHIQHTDFGFIPGKGPVVFPSPIDRIFTDHNGGKWLHPYGSAVKIPIGDKLPGESVHPGGSAAFPRLGDGKPYTEADTQLPTYQPDSHYRPFPVLHPVDTHSSETLLPAQPAPSSLPWLPVPSVIHQLIANHKSDLNVPSTLPSDVFVPGGSDKSALSTETLASLAEAAAIAATIVAF